MLHVRLIATRYYFLLGIIFMAFLAQSSLVLDQTQWPKILVLTIGFLVLIIGNFNYYLEALRKQSIISILLLSLLLWTAVSSSWAVSVPESLGEMAKLAVCWLFAMLCYLEIKPSSDQLVLFLKMLSIVLLSSLVVGTVEICKVPDFKADSMYGVTSICGHRNAFSSFVFLASIFNLIYFKNANGYWKIIVWLNIVLGSFTILLLQTRAVYIAVFIALLCYATLHILLYRKWKLALLVSGLILLLVTLLFIFKNIASFSILYKLNVFNLAQSASGSERLKVWVKTWELFKEYPLTGVGAGSWQFLYLKNGWGDLAYLNATLTTFQRPHNDFLWVASELGLTGFMLWISVFFIPIFLGLRHLYCINDIETRHTIMLLGSGVVGYLVISFFDFPKERIQHQLLIVAMLCLLYSYGTAGKERVVVVSKYIIWIVILVDLGSVFITWQRMRGEHYMAKIYNYRAQQHWAQVVKLTKKINLHYYDTDPTSVPVVWYSGLAYFSLGEYENAKHELAKALVVSPYNPHVLNNYASATEMLGNHEEAKKYYQLALQLLPTFDESLLNLAVIYFNENNFAKAKSLVLQAKPSKRKNDYLKAINLR